MCDRGVWITHMQLTLIRSWPSLALGWRACSCSAVTVRGYMHISMWFSSVSIWIRRVFTLLKPCGWRASTTKRRWCYFSPKSSWCRLSRYILMYIGLMFSAISDTLLLQICFRFHGFMQWWFTARYLSWDAIIHWFSWRAIVITEWWQFVNIVLPSRSSSASALWQSLTWWGNYALVVAPVSSEERAITLSIQPKYTRFTLQIIIQGK